MGFTGEMVSPLGVSNLIVMMGKHPEQATRMMEFNTVDMEDGAYSGIIGLPALSQFEAMRYSWLDTKGQAISAGEAGRALERVRMQSLGNGRPHSGRSRNAAGREWRQSLAKNYELGRSGEETSPLTVSQRKDGISSSASSNLACTT
ncbi:hypothetical protein LIER_32658 [Lithospermum erythrorhizon]|uniref:Uncharacterized protein n=1 Tax=Lithospermum erythrorhizon TaxID=34254 RepID=A0AAV3RXK8_LITER